MSARTSYTPEERRERLDTAHAEMTAAVERIASSEDWTAFLSFASKLHHYSAGNRIWLFEQAQLRGRDELDHVAGFRTWLGLGRCVRKGERGLQVLAPVRVQIIDAAGDGTSKKWIVRGFKVEHVFAACQTDGDGEVPAPIRPELLSGEGPEGAWSALVSLVEAKGYSVERSPLFPANGTTSFTTRKVIVADRLEDAAAVKTLAHELAHVLLHEHADYHANRSRCEVEAESVAYLVCEELGLSTDAYSFPYVTTWADGDAKVVTATADAALKAAETILGELATVRELVAV